MAIILFSLSGVLFFGAIRFFLVHQRSGVYPPKQVLKKKIAALAGGGLLFLFAGWLLFSL
ncbi:hypothetical protein RCG23_06745 [Neobacillus sp. PS3-34]|uniref:hypothetical protein n=1 Tax=Neobacillus sp. PS3-34 TaxID=3070678 RepID=UPI0027E002CF|nr:hypothetical protein [Neobacillus sp. PS3-34]WML49650.1 hypothetical protein RCG23_06745 [Neobacillus sp. PS3-34]